MDRMDTYDSHQEHQDPHAAHAIRSLRRVKGEMAEFTHLQQQKRAVNLLLVGALSGLCGFLVSTAVGLYTYFYDETQTNYLGLRFPSSNNYKPQTVSEMVHDTSTPQGKAFFAFCLVAAICILMSWYPWELRNVYSGDDRLVFWCCGPAWANFRHFLPPLGLLLVACIPVSPPVNRDFGETVVISFHTLGAVLMIGGYCIAEIHCLIWGARHSFVVFKPGEWYIRAVLILFCLACGITFQVCGMIANNKARSDCWDVWRVPTPTDLAALQKDPTLEGLSAKAADGMRLHRKLLYNTASGYCLRVKGGEFWFEVLAGIFMIFSMLTVWFFCPERHIDLDEQLPQLSKADMRLQGYNNRYVKYGHGPDPESDEESSAE